MTPIHFPLSARDRRAAMRPTRVRTESRTSAFVLKPAVPYVYTRPSGAGCFCAASATGSDMVGVRWMDGVVVDGDVDNGKDANAPYCIAS